MNSCWESWLKSRLSFIESRHVVHWIWINITQSFAESAAIKKCFNRNCLSLSSSLTLLKLSLIKHFVNVIKIFRIFDLNRLALLFFLFSSSFSLLHHHLLHFFARSSSSLSSFSSSVYFFHNFEIENSSFFNVFLIFKSSH